MRITYGSEVDAMYIKFSDKQRDSQQEINEETIIDLSADGSIVGIEILDATKTYSYEILKVLYAPELEAIKLDKEE